MSDSRSSKSSRLFETLLVVCLLVAVSAGALTWFYDQGSVLYFGDALAHLNIARRIVDSRTPGIEQIGTVWLPLPHLLMLPFVGNDTLWRSGLAGAIPSAFCYVVAGVFLFAGVRRALRCSRAAMVALAVFALNPNLLYMQSVPMTEAVFAACLCALLYFTVVFAETRALWAVVGAGAAALAGSLTRYEGWFLIPFVTAYLLMKGGRKRWLAALLFGVIASVGPLSWMLHNVWYYADPLEFYHGQWSAKSIYQRSLDAGMQPYRGDGNWPDAFHYYLSAARLCAGWPLAALGLIGAGVALWKRRPWAVALMTLPPAFYIWSIYSSGTPVFVPGLWPHSYYNTRYGLAGLPLLAVGAGALTAWVPVRFGKLAAIGVAVVALSPWVWRDAPESWICWKEAEVNSVQRRAWTREAADFLRERYRGGGILYPFGDMTAIFLEAGIPLRETIHSGNAPEFDASLVSPVHFLRAEWVIAYSGDDIATTLLRLNGDSPRFECVKIIALKNAPVIEIYRRIQ